MQFSMIKLKKTKMFQNISIAVSGILFTALSAQSQTIQEAIKFTDNEQFETATRAYKALLKGQPANGDIYFYLGENYFKNDDVDSAFYYYKKGFEAGPTSPLNYVGQGKLLQFEGKSTEAKTQFDKALTMGAGKNIVVLLKVAEALIKAPQKDLDQAAKLLEIATKLDPKNPEVYILTGDMYI
jgi:tetratricopeptide (TPR) repeat protein